MPGAVAILLARFPSYSPSMLRTFSILLLLTSSGLALAEDAVLSPARQRDVQLDSLFGELRGSGGADAQSIASRIWDVWSRPVSPTAEVLLSQASSAMASKDYDTAETILSQLIASYPDFPEGWNRRATMYYVMGKYEQSLKDIDKVLDLEPRHFGALAGQGLIYQKQQNWSKALASFQQALRINPGMLDVKEAIRTIEKLERDI